MSLGSPASRLAESLPHASLLGTLSTLSSTKTYTGHLDNKAGALKLLPQQVLYDCGGCLWLSHGTLEGSGYMPQHGQRVEVYAYHLP